MTRSAYDDIAVARLAKRPARASWWLAVTAGFINLLSAALPAERRRLEALNDYIPGTVSSGASAAVAAAGLAMFLIAGGLRRRSRVAWVIGVLLLSASAIGHILKGLDLEEALVESFLAGMLTASGTYFRARPDAYGGWLRRVGEAVVVVTGVMAFGLIGVFASVDNVPLHRAVVEVARMATGFGTSLALPQRFDDVLPWSLTATFYLGLLVVVARTLAPRPRPLPQPATPDEAAATDDSLAWFATRDDRTTIHAGASAVAYATQGAVALAAGNPLGERRDWERAADAFFAEAAHQGRVAAVLACTRDAADMYKSRGLRAIYLGDEAILNLEQFTLEGKAMKTVRGSRSRAVRAGYTAQTLRVGDLDSQTAAALRQLSEEWRQGEPERGFSMALGRLFAEEDKDTLVTIGKDAEGVPRGFLHFVPWRDDGASLDVMRRDREAIAVLNDFLVAEAAVQLRAMGIRRVSLNFSALRGVLIAVDDPDATRVLQIGRWLLLRLSRSFQIETLYRFNKKFDPEWLPRYLLVEAIEDAPRVLLAWLRLEGLLQFRFHRSPTTAPEGA